MKIGIIGYGSMGKMLLWKFSSNSKIAREDLYIANRTREKVLEAEEIAVVCDNRTLASECDIVFVCVRPVDMKAVLSDISTSLKDDALLVTLNGSITFDMIKKVVDVKTAKVIPSLTAEIDRSQTIVCYNGLISADDKVILRNLLGGKAQNPIALSRHNLPQSVLYKLQILKFAGLAVIEIHRQMTRKYFHRQNRPSRP